MRHIIQIHNWVGCKRCIDFYSKTWDWGIFLVVLGHFELCPRPLWLYAFSLLCCCSQEEYFLGKGWKKLLSRSSIKKEDIDIDGYEDVGIDVGLGLGIRYRLDRQYIDID